MKRRDFCAGLGLGAAASTGWLRMLAAQTAPGASRPNLIVILADDLGYECVGANGGTSYKTPVLDGLAATGVRFERCYAQPLCTPTRVQLMTGIYNVRNYIHFGNMDPQQTTFANLLGNAGYATCITGKWQLGKDANLPKRFGFDEACLWQHMRRPPRYANPGLEINGKAVDYSNGEYGPDLVNAYALDFITRHRQQPFFLYYPMILTHGPFQPTPDSPDWDPKAVGEKVNDKKEHFADMVAYMDKLIGKLVSHLEKLGLRDNTLILFLGDNGTGREIVSQMGGRPVHGGKGQCNETGMHVPLVAHWPRAAPAGKVCGDLVDTTDFLPTVCAAAGVAVPPDLKIDGRSFLPQIRGEKANPRPWVYCWFSRVGLPGAKTSVAYEFAFNPRYKLYADGRFFDLAEDEAEKSPLDVNALRGEAAETHRMLKAALDQYQDARPAP